MKSGKERGLGFEKREKLVESLWLGVAFGMA